MSLQLQIDRRLAQRYPKSFWRRIYDRKRVSGQAYPGASIIAALIGVVMGWLLLYLSRAIADSAQWDLRNNLANVQWLFPPNLPPLRSVLFVATLLQGFIVYLIVNMIPTWSEMHEVTEFDEETELPVMSFYCRLPLAPADLLEMFFRELPWKFWIIVGLAGVSTFYPLLFLAYHGRWGMLPVVFGLFAGGTQAWLAYHLLIGIWVVENHLRASPSIWGKFFRLSQFLLAMSWIVVFCLPLIIRAGWVAWLFRLPELILDPQHPQATFGAFSGLVYYTFMTVFPTGWLNAVLEQGLTQQIGWGWLLLVPLSVLALAHWKRGHVIWSMEHTVERQAIESSIEAAEDVQTEDYGSTEQSTTLGTTERFADSGEIRLALKQHVERSPFLRSMPVGRCGPFAAPEAELAKQVFFPEVSVRSSGAGRVRQQGRRFFRFLWFFFPTLLLLLLIVNRIQGRLGDLLMVLMIIGVHAGLVLVPKWILWDLDGEIRRGLLQWPTHADWLVALYVRSSGNWCLKWLGILAVVWLPIMKWVDRLGFVQIGVQFVSVILLMNVVVAGLAFARTLDLWNGIIKAERSGFFDWRSISLRREFSLTVGSLFWAITHVALVLEIGFGAPLLVVWIQAVISIACSWIVLYSLKRHCLYPAG